jgi:hypothetical protein
MGTTNRQCGNACTSFGGASGNGRSQKEVGENLEVKMELLKSFDKEKGHMEH